MKRRIALPPIIAAGIRRAERERKAWVISQPMRNMLDVLAQGEVYEINGQPVMRMPEIDEQFAKQAEWCAICPAIRGWIDCWSRIAPDISTYHLGVLADRLERDKPITPRLIEQAREEFERTWRRIPDIPDKQISAAITTTQIAWEMEKLQEQA